MIHWSRLVYRLSYIKQDCQYTGLDQCIDCPTQNRIVDTLVSTSLDQCIDCPTKSRTYDTLVLTTVSIVLNKVGFTIHWSRLVHRLAHKKQDLPYTGLDRRFDSPTGEQDQRFVGLKTGKIGLVGLSTRIVGLLVRSIGLQVCRTIARRNIEMTPPQNRYYLSNRLLLSLFT